MADDELARPKQQQSRSLDRHERLDLHVYHHDDPSAIELLHEHIETIRRDLTSAIEAQGAIQMSVLTEIQAKVVTLTAAVAANTQVDTSIVTLLQGLTSMIASLRQQLADAIAAGNNDPALQAVLDGLNAVETTINTSTQTLADAAVANTPRAAA